MNKKLIAADIGGSKSRIRLLDTDGTVLSETVGTGVADSEDHAAPLPTLETLISEVSHGGSVGAVAINLGGKNTGQVLTTFRKFFPDAPIKIFRESEGTAAFALGKEYGAPIILMAGTGAIAVGQWKGHFVTAGGWGINVGDAGSGYDIGLQAVRMSLAALDNTEPLSPLAKCICGCEEPLAATQDPSVFKDNRDQVREKIAPFDRQHIASFTKIVAEFAERGDRSALEIFEYAGKNLAELVINTGKKLGDAQKSIVVTGGLIHTKKFWGKSFEAVLKDFRIQYVCDGLLYGTYLIAKELYEQENQAK